MLWQPDTNDIRLYLCSLLKEKMNVVQRGYHENKDVWETRGTPHNNSTVVEGAFMAVCMYTNLILHHINGEYYIPTDYHIRIYSYSILYPTVQYN